VNYCGFKSVVQTPGNRYFLLPGKKFLEIIAKLLQQMDEKFCHIFCEPKVNIRRIRDFLNHIWISIEINK
jgi:hypothetical protein